MQSKNFVICDGEQEYVKNLMEALSSRKELGFQMHFFQEWNDLEEFSKERTIHILLSGEDFPPDWRQRVLAESRFILTKGAARSLLPGEKSIFKYQSWDAILNQVLEVTMDGGELAGKGCVRGEGKLLGIYSPVHRIGKTKFALELGTELAREGPVLYLNLEEYSGGSYYFPENMEHNLSDLLYYVRQDKGNIGLRLSAMAGRISEVDYILPIPVMQDLRAVEEAEWLRLFHKIFEHSIYKSVLLDLGDGVNGLYQILRHCHTVYTLYGDDEISQAKLRQYTENLRRTGFEDVLEHTVQKRIIRKGGETI